MKKLSRKLFVQLRLLAFLNFKFSIESKETKKGVMSTTKGFSFEKWS